MSDKNLTKTSKAFMHRLTFLVLFLIMPSHAFELVDVVKYEQRHSKIVESGQKAIFSFYKNNNIEEKRSLLLCLDMYLDPYYNYNLSYTNNIFDWLDTELKKTTSLKLKEDIFELLRSYSDLGYEDCEMSESGGISCNEHSNVEL
jgi:hypothetical protein